MKKAHLLLLIIAVAIFGISAFSSLSQEPNKEVALGKTLFFDSILSGNRTISCASCHREAFAFADTASISLGVFGRKGKRNTPSAMNMAMQSSFFWDGRAVTLEEQALIPIANPDEMDLPIDSAVTRLNKSAFYRNYFKAVYGNLPSREHLAQALAAFERSLETNDSPFDDWRLNDNEAIISESAKRGFDLFQNKGNCIQCHFGADFNSSEFRNIGLFNGRELTDSGRATITRKTADLGKFKIGPLRNIALTAPYMHNGMFKTLRAVIDHYDNPDKMVPGAINRDPLLAKPLNLSEQEKTDLENFLLSLTDTKLSVNVKLIKK